VKSSISSQPFNQIQLLFVAFLVRTNHLSFSFAMLDKAYFKDLKVIVVDPNLHPYKKRHLIAHGLAHHLLFYKKIKANYFINDKDDF